jgi:hypothetical protein
MFVLSGAAASSALDLISTLQQTLSAKTSQTSAQPTASFGTVDPGAGTSATSPPASAPCAPMSPGTMDAMLTVQGQAGAGQGTLVNGDAFSSQLFSLLDSNGDGSVSKSEFETAFGQNGNTAQADSIFSQLDADGDGSVTSSELTSAIQGGQQAQGSQSGQQVHHHHHHGGGVMGGASSAGGASGSDSASGGAGSADDLLGGDTSQTIANSDGSSTTTITYADGSSVAMTTPAAGSTGSSSDAATAMKNAIEQMIQRQAQMLAGSAGQSLMMNV